MCGQWSCTLLHVLVPPRVNASGQRRIPHRGCRRKDCVISGVTHPLHKIAARQQTDGGAAAQVELNVCARAALLITCTGALPGAQYCTKCARAYSSFVSRLLAVRAEVRPESGAVGW